MATTRKGKIARLPMAIRDEVCSRLRDNQPGSKILPWLNGLPETKALLDEHFEGEPVSDQNLSQWRSGGFDDWLQKQDEIDEIRLLSEYSLRAAKAAGGNLSEGLLAANAGKIQLALEDFWVGVRGCSGEKGEDKDEATTKLLTALASIRGLEIKTHELRLKERAGDVKERELALEEVKFQRTTAELFLKWYDDRRAREIMEGKGTKEIKVAQLIQLAFGEMPKNIGPEALR